MLTLYFYSVPNSTIPSPYFKRVPAMLRDLSRKGILRFRLWQGRHDAPVPLGGCPEEEGPKTIQDYRASIPITKELLQSDHFPTLSPQEEPSHE